MSKLDSKKVNEIFLYCLFNSGEDTSIHVVGEGVKLRAGFHPERLKEKESTISEMLGELPEIIVELTDGTIEQVLPSNLKFVDLP